MHRSPITPQRWRSPTERESPLYKRIFLGTFAAHWPIPMTIPWYHSLVINILIFPLWRLGFLGPRGPLRVPIMPVGAKNFNQWKFTINHYIIMSDLSNHIFSESSWPPQSTDAPRWQRRKKLKKNERKLITTGLYKFKPFSSIFQLIIFYKAHIYHPISTFLMISIISFFFLTTRCTMMTTERQTIAVMMITDT